MKFAVELDENDVVLRVIVGDAEWAVEALGGLWVGVNDLVGIGWRLVDGQWIAPPPPPVVEEPDSDVV